MIKMPLQVEQTILSSEMTSDLITLDANDHTEHLKTCYRKQQLEYLMMPPVELIR